MRHLIFISVIMVLGAWLVGCTGTTSSGILLDYRRSGGFVGLDDHLVIDVKGKARLTRKAEHYEFVLDGETMNRLQALLDDAEFTQLGREYLPPQPGADFFEYVITHQGHTVRAIDTAVPDALWPVLELLNQIVETRGRL